MPKIERLPSGTYRVRISVGKGADGKYKYRSFTAKNKDALRRKIAQFDGNDEQAPLLCDAIEDYIEAREAILSPYSIKGYRNICRTLKRLPCATVRCDVGTSGMQIIINELVKMGKSPKTVRNYAGLITASLKFAGYTAPNLTLPQKEKQDVFIPSEEIMRRVLDVVRDTDLEVPVALGMMGLRRGEVCGLRMEDINDSVAHIQRAAVDIGGEVTMKRPKTYDSDRFVRLPDAICEKIKEQGYVTKMRPDYLSHRFVLMLKQNDLPRFRFHDLRHFFVSYAHNVLKLSDAQIQKMGGWRTDRIMKLHYLQSMNDDHAQRLAAAGFEKIMT